MRRHNSTMYMSEMRMYDALASMASSGAARFLDARAWIMHASRKNEKAMLMYTYSYGDPCIQGAV